MDVISSSKTTDSTPPSSQIVTIHSDKALFPTGFTLTGSNYALWSQVMEMHIATREKLGYLTCDNLQPSKLSSTHNKWCTEIRYPDRWDHFETPRKNGSKSLKTSSNSDPVNPAVSTTPAPASTSVATTGTQGYVLHISSKKHTWIIDTRAIDHMTFDPGQIASHAPPPPSVVSNANGTASPLIGEGHSQQQDNWLWY
ncbi:unnamed protein product [Prunus armeniaca]